MGTLNQVADREKQLKRLARKQQTKVVYNDVKNIFVGDVDEKLGSRMHIFTDGFAHHANLIRDQVETKGFATKSQIEYLMLYNSHKDWEDRILFDEEVSTKTEVIDHLRGELKEEEEREMENGTFDEEVNEEIKREMDDLADD